MVSVFTIQYLLSSHSSVQKAQKADYRKTYELERTFSNIMNVSDLKKLRTPVMIVNILFGTCVMFVGSLLYNLLVLIYIIVILIVAYLVNISYIDLFVASQAINCVFQSMKNILVNKTKIIL